MFDELLLIACDDLLVSDDNGNNEEFSVEEDLEEF